jgi:epoxyqueuosine reductase
VRRRQEAAPISTELDFMGIDGLKGSICGKEEAQMIQENDTATAILAKAESFPDTRAGLARVADVLNGPSYRAKPDGEWTTSLSNDAAVTKWPSDARTVLVLGLHHPEDSPRLDWWERGNTWGNKLLMERSEHLKTWLEETHGLKACPLPYHLEKGGLFLKDAAVLAGLGVIGRSNLLLHQEWGPRIRLRALLIEGDLPPSQPLERFSPCSNCDLLCWRACPKNAFPGGAYSRPRCLVQLNQDRETGVPEGEIGEDGTPNPVIRFCRACELACPVGA